MLWKKQKEKTQALVTIVPAKLRIPKQLDGCNWRNRNLQHASRTDCTCNRLEAGNKTYNKQTNFIVISGNK